MARKKEQATPKQDLGRPSGKNTNISYNKFYIFDLDFEMNERPSIDNYVPPYPNRK